MPSQISLRTSPVVSDHMHRIPVGHINSNGENEMKAAARTVGSLIMTHNSMIKPHNIVSINLNGSCGKTDKLDATSEYLFPKPPSKANGTTPHTAILNKGSNSRVMDTAGHTNGAFDVVPVFVPPPIHHDSNPPKTEGEHSNQQSSLTNEPNGGRLMCPELAIGYTGTLIGKRAVCLANKQRGLENRVASLQRRVRIRQLEVVHSHVCKQLHFDGYDDNEDQSVEDGSASSFTVSDSSMGGVSPIGSHMGAMSLPIQVDGASDDAFLPSQCQIPKMEGEGRVRNEDSFSSLDSFGSSAPSEVEEGGAQALTAQLTSLRGLLDCDLTEESSDEEESADQSYRQDLRSFWEHTRSGIGSRWMWLQRRIAELNKQIYRLDHHVKGSFSQGKFEFSAPSISTAASATSVLPQYFSIANGSVLEHLRTSNGGSLIAVSKPGTKPGGNNGFSHHHHPTGLAHYFPHLLLPGGLLGAKLQVKDLLSPSPVERSMHEASCTAARTRSLLRRANRRVVRRKVSTRVHCSSQHPDVAFHPHLSMAHELPSRIPLDFGLKQILSEHTYSQLPPLSKRRKAASQLPQLSTPDSHDHDLEPCHSPSASPVHTPLSLDSSRDGSNRRRYPPLLQYQSSVDSSPWSPGMSRPATPNFTPLQSARKRRITSSTPSFDIDNIVIPYFMASSTRLEKLEYKEIITPSWREVNPSPTSEGEEQQGAWSGVNSRQPSPSTTASDGSAQPQVQVQGGREDDEEEDCSDQVFTARHNRCELLEKKRFFNFISGGQRKRSRPQSMTFSDTPSCRSQSMTLSDTPSLSSPPPQPQPPRCLTIASPSPTHADSESTSRMYTVVLPWQPRVFPLDEAEQDALVAPPPPPPILTQLSSPSLGHTSTLSQTPSCTSSALATPVGSPHSTLSEDIPAISPAEWVVNSQCPPPTLCNHHFPLDTAGSAFVPPPGPLSVHNPIILKLTKKA